MMHWKLVFWTFAIFAMAPMVQGADIRLHAQGSDARLSWVLKPKGTENELMFEFWHNGKSVGAKELLFYLLPSNSIHGAGTVELQDKEVSVSLLWQASPAGDGEVLSLHALLIANPAFEQLPRAPRGRVKSVLESYAAFTKALGGASACVCSLQEIAILQMDRKQPGSAKSERK